MVPHVDYMSNRLSLSGPADSVRKASEALGLRADAAPDFHRVTPPELDVDPYAARVEAWGCDFPQAAEVVVDEPGRLDVTFDTGTGVPRRVVESLSRLFPDLRLVLASVWSSEPVGHSFRGEWTAGRGELRPVEATRAHYADVRPQDEEWQVDEAFPDRDAPSPR